MWKLWQGEDGEILDVLVTHERDRCMLGFGVIWGWGGTKFAYFRALLKLMRRESENRKQELRTDCHSIHSRNIYLVALEFKVFKVMHFTTYTLKTHNQVL